MSSSTSLNGSDDAVECNDNTGSDICLLNDDHLLDDHVLDDCLLGDEDKATNDSLEDLDQPDTEPAKPRPCLNRTGVVVVGAAVVGVFVVIGIIVVVILSVLSLRSSSKVSHPSTVYPTAKLTHVLPSTTAQPSRLVTVTLDLSENCSTRIVGSVEDGVRSFKVCTQCISVSCCVVLLVFNVSNHDLPVCFIDKFSTFLFFFKLSQFFARINCCCDDIVTAAV